MTKIDQNSVFLGRGTHIPNQFYIMVIYINFYILFKILNFDSKSKGDSFRVYQKMRACEKMIETPYFLIVKPIFWIAFYIMVTYIYFYGF
jgi:hypothetical protein